MRTSVKISVVTPTYNSERHLVECLESIHAQQGADFEHVVVDGGSRDGTLAILDRYRDRIAQLVSERDDGISDAFNKGIALCRGDVILIVASDDLLLPDALARIAADWGKRGACDVIYGNVLFLDAVNGNAVIRPDRTMGAIWGRQPLKHAAMVVSADAYRRFGAYDKRWRLAMDYELTLRFHLCGASFRYLDAELAAVRPGGASYRNLGRTMREVAQIAETHGANKLKTRCLLAWKICRIYLRSFVLSSRFAAPATRLYRRVNTRFKTETKQ